MHTTEHLHNLTGCFHKVLYLEYQVISESLLATKSCKLNVVLVTQKYMQFHWLGRHKDNENS